eukprot:SM000221S06945  [mRNA]  locus=s221:121538:125521:- [translate_table: standard]
MRQLARLLGEKADAVEAALASLGELGTSLDAVLSPDAAELVALVAASARYLCSRWGFAPHSCVVMLAQEFGRSVRFVRNKSYDGGSAVRASEEERSSWPARSAVVTVMGHVDHGKTTLLDALRSTSVAVREAGGITQHIGAFRVSLRSGAELTFLDTPGHAAFSAMRARGAALTDIVVLVVAAEDGVMPQTVEAARLAEAAGVPIVVAISKCDLPQADTARVRRQLSELGLALEDAGGDVQVVEISAGTGAGLVELEEALLLQSELLDLRGRDAGDAEGVVVEARVDRGQGPLATIIVHNGLLQKGTFIVAGAQWGRVRALRDEAGRPIDAAGPSMPAEVDGLRGLPEAGDEVLVVADKGRARRLSAGRQRRAEEARIHKLNQRIVSRGQGNEEEAAMPAARKGAKRRSGLTEDEELRSTSVLEKDVGHSGHSAVQMPVIVKADVKGTVQAVSAAIECLSSPQVDVSIVHEGVGAISQSDVDLAEACGAVIVAFNVKSTADAAARRAGVDAHLRLIDVTQILSHKVIYHLLEEVGGILVARAPGVKESRVAGQAEVLQVFEVKGRGREQVGATIIAGLRLAEGKLQRSSKVKVLRSGETVFEGSCQTLKREKAEVDEVAGKGSECGMTLQIWAGFQVGDVVQCLEDVVVPPRLISSQNGSMRIEM